MKVCVSCMVSSVLCLRMKDRDKRGNARSFIDNLAIDTRP